MSQENNEMPDWMDDEVQRKMKRREKTTRPGCVVIGLIVLAVVITPLICVGVFVPLISWAVNSLQGMGDTANEFMLALRDAQYEDAFALMSDSYQQEVGHPENLVGRLGGSPQDWQFNSFDSTNNFGTINGTVQVDGVSRGIILNLIYDGSAWRVVSVFY